MHLTPLMIALCSFLKELNVAKEKRRVRPVRKVAPHSDNSEQMRSQMESSPVMTQQSKSFPGGQHCQARTPSVSSHNSLDSSISRWVNTTEIVWACSIQGGKD
jgi:hypothetical protein